jgi:hypothetical protein
MVVCLACLEAAGTYFGVVPKLMVTFAFVGPQKNGCIANENWIARVWYHISMWTAIRVVLEPGAPVRPESQISTEESRSANRNSVRFGVKRWNQNVPWRLSRNQRRARTCEE